MAFRLALAMRRLDVDAMLAELPVSLWREWKAFYNLERFGDRMADERHALLCALTAHGTSPPAKFTLYPPVKVQDKPLSNEEIRLRLEGGHASQAQG
jgi:hypothetical protein